MKRWMLGCLALAATAGCKQEQTTQPATRLELKKLGGERVQFIPAKDQLTYCLIFTRAEKGPLRLLTMTRDNRSPHCPAGKPVQGLTFRMPAEEGAVKVLAFFSDQRINAGSIAQQLFDQPDATPMNLRLPGNVRAQTLTFTPTVEAPVTEGEVVGSGGQISAGADGGVIVPSQPLTPENAGTAPSDVKPADAGTSQPAPAADAG
jgi:hypothetical protein